VESPENILKIEEEHDTLSRALGLGVGVQRGKKEYPSLILTMKQFYLAILRKEDLTAGDY